MISDGILIFQIPHYPDLPYGRTKLEIWWLSDANIKDQQFDKRHQLHQCTWRHRWNPLFLLGYFKL